nr:hypothetical protein [Micromonospora sp. DSM 115978]
MFIEDAQTMLTLHAARAEQFRAEAAADRLARSVPRPARPRRPRWWTRRRAGTPSTDVPARPVTRYRHP